MYYFLVIDKYNSASITNLDDYTVTKETEMSTKLLLWLVIIWNYIELINDESRHNIIY